MASITITLEENRIAEIFRQILKAEVALFKRQFLQHQNSNILTRKEAAAYLKIDLSTLWDWAKSGKIKAYGVGTRRVYFLKSELTECLTKKNEL